MRKEKGQVLIEMAIVLPLLFLLIFGLFDYARAMYTKNSLTNAARSGARVASVTPSADVKAETGILLTASKLSPTGAAVKSSLLNGIPPASVKYDLAIKDAVTGAPVTGTVVAGNVVEVTVTYGDFNMITPFYKLVALVTNSTPPDSSTISLSGQASMRYELQ